MDLGPELLKIFIRHNFLRLILNKPQLVLFVLHGRFIAQERADVGHANLFLKFKGKLLNRT